jgi:recombination protein RecR
LPCARCFNFTERGQELCEVCRNPRRDRQLICVVEEASDVLVLERNQLMSGVYHVLGGVLSPLDGIGPEDFPANWRRSPG